MNTLAECDPVPKVGHCRDPSLYVTGCEGTKQCSTVPPKTI